MTTLYNVTVPGHVPWPKPLHTLVGVKGRSSSMCMSTFSLADASMEMTERQTACTDSAGLQSSVRIERQMWPLLYTCGCTGMLSPTNTTSGESNGYFGPNLKLRLNRSLSYRVSDGPSRATRHLRRSQGSRHFGTMLVTDRTVKEREIETSILKCSSFRNELVCFVPM